MTASQVRERIVQNRALLDPRLRPCARLDNQEADGRLPRIAFGVFNEHTPDGLSDTDAASVAAAMSEVRREGLKAAKKLAGEIYEVIAEGDRQSFRILFAPEGEQDQVLLALEGFSKKTQKTPPAKVRLAHTRLADWRRRAQDL